MSGKDEWKSKEDFERDLMLFAEYSVPNDDASNMIRVPDTIQRYQQQMILNQQSNLVLPDLPDDTPKVKFAGRGRGVKGLVSRPGEGVRPCLSDEIELKKKIREVAGLGYSNEFIERTIKTKHEMDEEESQELASESTIHLQLQPATSTDRLSKTSLGTPPPTPSAGVQSSSIQTAMSSTSIARSQQQDSKLKSKFDLNFPPLK